MAAERKVTRADAPLLSLLLAIASLIAIPLVMFLMLALWSDSVARQLVAGAAIIVLVIFSLQREKYSALLFGAVFFSQFAISLHTFELAPPAILQIFFLDIIIVLLVWVGIEKGIRWRFDTVAWLFAGLILWQMVATAYSAHVERSLVYVIWQIKFLVVYLIIRNAQLNQRIASLVQTAVVLALGLQGAISVVQYLSGGLLGLKILGEPDPAEVLQFVGEGLRVFGTLGGTNSLAGYLATLLVFLLPQLFARRQWAMYAGAGLGCVALLLTFSRAGWLSFILGGAVIVMLLVRRRMVRVTRLTGMALITVILLGILSALFAGQIMDRFESRESVASAKARLIFAYQAWEVIQNYPILGIGPGITEFFGVWNDNAKYVKDALPNVKVENQVHNGHLQIWMESGTPAFFLWLMIVLLTVKSLFSRPVFASSSQAAQMVQLGAAAASVAFLVHITFGTEINNYRILLIFWIFLAIARNEHKEPPNMKSALGRNARKLIEERHAWDENDSKIRKNCHLALSS